MSEQHVDQGRRSFWKTMKNMTWKERIKHILYYYGKYILIVAFLVYMFTDLILYMTKEKPENLLSGTAINVHVSVDMEKRLTEDIFAHMGGTDTEKQEITLAPNELTQSDLHMISSMRTKLMSGTYDYALMDQEALGMVLTMEALPDLTLLLPEEKLAAWEDRFVYVQTDEGKYPVALNITGTPLAAECTFNGESLYLGFPVNKNTLQVVEPFFDYLTQQGLLTIP